mgnify:CR=1 FL=1
MEYTFLRASYGQGYRFPSIAEKYISSAVGPLNVFPNPNLEPEYGWSAEIGMKQGFKIKNFKGYFDVSGFVWIFFFLDLVGLFLRVFWLFCGFFKICL